MVYKRENFHKKMSKNLLKTAIITTLTEKLNKYNSLLIVELSQSNIYYVHRISLNCCKVFFLYYDKNDKAKKKKERPKRQKQK